MNAAPAGAGGAPARRDAPRATVRLQFHAGFTLDAAVELVPYFDALGISHLYASPLQASRRGSRHGYDCIGHDRIDPELGGEPALRRLAAALRAHGMGMILDIVPNHMAASPENPWWRDVLEHGPRSRHADHFDIDWDGNAEAGGRVVLPWLEAPLPELAQRGDLALRWDATQRRLLVHAGALRIPLGATSYAEVLGDPGAAAAPLGAVVQRFAAAHSAADFDAARTALAEAASQAPGQPALEAQLERLLPVDEPARAHLLALLDRQPWQLVPWREAPQRINWRRFFNINELVALRIDRAHVFDAVHALPLSLYGEGLIDGLRVDHVDGLRDPAAYLRRLRAELDQRAPQRPAGSPPGGWLLVEKILAEGETLPPDWPVEGTTGYDFMDQVGQLLHEDGGAAELERHWLALHPDARPFAAMALAARRQILGRSFVADLARVQRSFEPLFADRPASERAALPEALAALIVHLPVYRSYATAEGCSAADRAVLDRAAQAACDELDGAGAAALRQLVAIVCSGTGPAGLRSDALAALQQLTPPIAAKAVEDTALYRHARLLSRNEVGADPDHLAMTPERFHGCCRARLRQHPQALLATATHDHKRGEDARARLAVLSGQAHAWGQQLARWRAHNAPLRARLPGGEAPDAIDESMLYQTLLGAWPPLLHESDGEGVQAFATRVAAWQRKALRESKRRSSWSMPDEDYEQACAHFLARLLDPAHGFLGELAAAAARLAPAGALNALTQVLLRLTTPGVPDLYQGTEFWDHSLVDPDNRRAVDYDARRAALQRDEGTDSLLEHWRDGRIKQRLVARVLAARRAAPPLFAAGDYVPVPVHGPAAAHVIAFLRRQADDAALVVAPLHAAALLDPDGGLRFRTGAWEHTVLALPGNERARRWRCGLSARSLPDLPSPLPLHRVLHDWPVAFLLSA